MYSNLMLERWTSPKIVLLHLAKLIFYCLNLDRKLEISNLCMKKEPFLVLPLSIMLNVMKLMQMVNLFERV